MTSQTGRRVLGAIVAGSIAASLAACSGGGSTSGATGGEGSEQFVLGISQPVQAVEAPRNWQKGIEVQAAALGMKTVVADANLDPNKQLSDVQSMISQGVDALCLSPLDPQGIQPAVEQAKSRGIPVIGWSAGANSAELGYATNFEADDQQAGEDAAKLMAEQLGEGAMVAAIQGPPYIPISTLRFSGFEQGAKKYGLNLVAAQINESADGVSGATPIADAWKAKYGADLKGIFSYNDPSALGAAAVAGDGFQPLLTGVNGAVEAVDAIKQGRMLATWDQRTVETGNACAWAAYQLLTDETVPPIVNVQMPRIDASNVAKWRSPEELLGTALKISVGEKDGVAVLQTDAQPEG